MSGYQDRIQGKDRLLRVRRIRRTVQAVLAVLALMLLAGRLSEDGASLRPLYIPLEGIIEILLLAGVAAAAVGFFFRFLEIRYASRDSQKHLMAKYAMDRARTATPFVIFVGVLLLIPAASQAADGISTDPPMSIALAAGDTQLVNFTNPDSFSITFARSAYLAVVRGTVFVEVLRGAVVEGSATLGPLQNATLFVDPTGTTKRAEWSVRIENIGGSPAAVQLTINRGLMPALFTSIPVMLLVYAGLNVAWWIVLRPIRERTRTAVYAAGAVQGIPQGERLYAAAAMDPRVSMAESDFPPPPPPPPVAPTEAWAREVAPVPAFGAPRAPPRAEPTPREAAARAPRGAALPETLPGVLDRALALSAAGHMTEALSAYESALRLEPTSTSAWLGKARCLQKLDRRPEALDAYRHALVSDRQSQDAHRGIIALLSGEHRWRECLDATEEALQFRPNDPSLLEAKADVLIQLGRRPEALSAYEAAQALDPENEVLALKIEEARVDVPGLLSRALIASASANFALALKLLDDVLEVEPMNVNALIGKAVAYRRSGKPQEALNCLDLVLGIQPQNAAAILNRGHLLAESGDLNGALETFDRLVDLTPGDGDAWRAQGDVLTKMGRDDDALRAYAEALKLNPGDEDIQARIGALEDARSVPADVLQELYKVKGIGPTRAKALVEAGYRTADDFERASPDDLVRVHGITRKLAEELVKHFQGVALETL